MEKIHAPIKGLRCTLDDFIASLKSDYVIVKIAAEGGRSYWLNVKKIKKISGYYDFWRIEGEVEITQSICSAVLFVDYYEPEEAGNPPGGFGYIEISERF